MILIGLNHNLSHCFIGGQTLIQDGFLMLSPLANIVNLMLDV